MPLDKEDIECRPPNYVFIVTVVVLRSREHLNTTG